MVIFRPGATTFATHIEPRGGNSQKFKWQCTSKNTCFLKVDKISDILQKELGKNFIMWLYDF